MDQGPVPQVQPQGMEALMSLMQTMGERFSREIRESNANLISRVNEKLESQAKTAEENSRPIIKKINSM